MSLRGLRSGATRLKPFEALARAAAESTAAETDGEGWQALDAAFARTARRRRRGLAAAALVLALGLGGGALWRARGDRLSYVVDGAVSDADGYIPRVQTAGADVRFSDGTVVTLGAGSRARVVATGTDGAQLRLEDGHAHLSVVHRRHTRWAVEAGPFVVQVTGTTFDVRWSAGEGVLHVRLLAGVVTVRGPLTRGGVTLQPGQELEARPDDGVLRIVPVAAPAAEESANRPGAAGAGVGAAASGLTRGKVGAIDFRHQCDSDAQRNPAAEIGSSARAYRGTNAGD